MLQLHGREHTVIAWPIAISENIVERDSAAQVRNVPTFCLDWAAQREKVQNINRGCDFRAIYRRCSDIVVQGVSGADGFYLLPQTFMVSVQSNDW